jgi:hypothetical protein
MHVASAPPRFSVLRPHIDLGSSCRQALSLFLSVSVTISVIGLDGCKKSEPAQSGQAQQGQAQQGQAPATQAAVPTADQLYQLVAPIALFPDNLVAQVLAASTYPNEVSAAYTWLQQNSSLKGQQLLQAVNEQSWDPSVKGLTQFSDVLSQMATNLSWTSALGDAYYNYPSSVMNAVQVMRARAQQSGNLKSTQQQRVSVQSQPPGQAPPPPPPADDPNAPPPQTTVIVQPPAQTIIIQPAQPDVVYLPTYNPTVVYGAPVPVYPGYSTGAMVATSLLSFGVGIAVGAAISGGGGCCGWGWNSWGCGWHNNTVVYNHNTYISNSNTFVNRNNYYNHNNVNVNNFNRNNVNVNNVNRNNANGNNVNRNNFNNNNRTNNFKSGSYSEPHFNQKLDAPQYQNRQNGGQQGNLGQNRGQQNLGGQNRENLGQNQNRQNLGQNQNRQNMGQNQNRAAANNQNLRNDGARGYGQQPTRGSGSNAFGDYQQGGSARMNSARGQQSLQGGRANAAPANRGGGNAGGGNRGGGERGGARGGGRR